MLRNLEIIFILSIAKIIHMIWKMEGIVWFIRAGLPHKKYIIPVLKRFGADISNDCDIEGGIWIHNANTDFSKLCIKKNVHIGKDVFFDLADRIYIAENSTISMRAVIITHMDVGKSKLSKIYQTIKKPVIIGADTYIGADAIILPGVRVGIGSLIAAGSVVNRNVLPNCVVGGIPSKKIKKINLK